MGPKLAGFRALMKCRNDELSKWERFALNRVEKGKAAAPFKVEFIHAEERDEILTELRKAKLSDSVRHIFATRQAGVPAMRLNPPAKGESAEYKAEIEKELRNILEREAVRIANGG